MKSINQYINESQDKYSFIVSETNMSYFTQQEIDKITKDINDKNGQFIKFVDDKVDKKLDWKAAYNDYFDQCLVDIRCASELAAYIEMIIGRHNFSLEQMQKFIKDEL